MTRRCSIARSAENRSGDPSRGEGSGGAMLLVEIIATARSTATPKTWRNRPAWPLGCVLFVMAKSPTEANTACPVWFASATPCQWSYLLFVTGRPDANSLVQQRRQHALFASNDSFPA